MPPPEKARPASRIRFVTVLNAGRIEPQMEDAGPGGPATRYRLRGEVAGVERSYALAPGRNRIGSVRDNDIMLPVRGVSRHHAVVVLDTHQLLTEDLESKNGVRVNGARVRRSRLEPGDEIRFGPVSLRLEVVEAADIELAVALQGGQLPPLSPSSAQTTTPYESPAVGADRLSLVEAFLGRVVVVPQSDLGGALGVLTNALPAQGACLLEWAQGHEPVVLAASGEIESLWRAGVHELLKKALPQGPPGALGAASTPGTPSVSCAVLLGAGTERLALATWGRLPEPSESESLLRTLLCLVDRFRPRPLHPLEGQGARPPRGLTFPRGYVPGSSPVMASLYGQMLPLLQGDLPVLILGETGVGKEYLARILHLSSARRDGPFVALNCAAIPADLLEAEMFGIGKGIATGVVERKGRFELAQGGTLFLDEIGDMSLDLQAKLLRAVQEKEIQPVGGAPVPVDIRVTAATNTDLLQRIEEGRFRRDLYYRVAGYALRVPPLRERKDDLPAFVEDFMRRFSEETGKSVRGITVKALRVLTDYRWPGNIRELEHEVRRLVYLCPDGQALDSTMLSSHVFSPAPIEEQATPAVESLDLEAHLHKVEAELIRQALARAGGNRSQAAKLLGVSRNGLAIKMERLGIKD